jgi:hypothetical protein
LSQNNLGASGLRQGWGPGLARAKSYIGKLFSAKAVAQKNCLAWPGQGPEPSRGGEIYQSGINLKNKKTFDHLKRLGGLFAT